MQIPGFIGGTDVQRSTNLSDNKLINLYPTTDNGGAASALVTTPGLALYLAIPSGAIASGIYTASNGRCFMVAVTTLYEVTTGGVLTVRGTVTAGTVTRMIDNGIDMILVNGVDGWIFTLATNALRKIKVISQVATVSVAAPGVITSVAHGLIAGDRFRLSTTGALPTGLATSTTYYVIAAGLTADALQLSLTLGGTAITTTGTQSGAHTITSVGYGFPNGTKLVSYMNGRFIANMPGGQSFYVSEVLDGGYWDALNVQTADSNPDKTIGLITTHAELVVFGELTGEIFYDSGTYPAPYVRVASGVFEVGCVSPYSIARIDNSVVWLGKSSTGYGIVYRLNGFTPQRISTFSIEYAIQAMTDITDAIAFTYQQDGHHFYCLNFPIGGRSFVYDLNTQMWHERASMVDGSFTRWEAQEYAFFDNKHLVCDYNEGSIYSLSLDGYTYGTTPLKWVRSFTAPASDMRRVIHHKLSLSYEGGTGLIDGTEGQIVMRFSDDGGHTWAAENAKGMGKLGNYQNRVYWHRLGMTKGRPRIYELSGTTAVKTVLIAAYLD